MNILWEGMLIITGLPGTGKTTLGQQLAASLSAVHLNTDIIREQLGKRGQYDAQTKEIIYRELLRQAEHNLQQGRRVLIDGTFYLLRVRRLFMELAAKLNVDLRWIELRADESVIRKRVDQKREHTDADFHVYQQIKSQYEPIDQAHLVLWSDQLSPEEMSLRAMEFLSLPK